MFSIIVSIKDNVMYETTLYPSLQPIIKFLRDNHFSDLQIIKVSGDKSITKNYNRGMNQAKYPIKIFIHEDVDLMDADNKLLFIKIMHMFDDPETGLVGLVGTKAKSKSFWWECEKKDMVGHVLNGRHKEYWLWDCKKEYYNVKYIDGMFMATDTNIPFSEDITGFHLYDVDYCNVVRKNNYKIKVIPHLVNHISSGKSLDKVDIDYYQKKWGLV